jgi:hypothetical protein
MLIIDKKWELERVLKCALILKDRVINDRSKIIENDGICENLMNIYNNELFSHENCRLYGYEICEIFYHICKHKKLKHYAYPVYHWIGNQRKYQLMIKNNKNMWIKAYGKTRIKFLDYMISELKKLIT